MKQFSFLKAKIRECNYKIFNLKLVKFSIISSIIIFLSGLFAALIIAVKFGPRGYNLWDNFISDLGSLRYTPTPFIFDITAMLTALLQVPIYYYFVNQILLKSTNFESNSDKKLSTKISFNIIKKLAKIALIFLIISSIGFFGIGVFSEDRTTILELHLIFAILVFTGLTFGASFSGFIIIINRTIIPKFIGIYMVLGPLIAAILYLFPPLNVTRFFLEWMMLSAALIWAIPSLLIMYNKIRKIEK